MAFEVGEVAVTFVAQMDDLFKSLEKLGKKLDEALSGKQEIKVSFDDRIVGQIEKIADGVEKISTLTERFRDIASGVFDLMDGKIGNTSEQIEKDFGGALKGVGDDTTDFITKFINTVTSGISRLSPLVMGQLFGATLLIERLVAGSFKLSALLPKFLIQGTGIVGIFNNLIRAVKTLDLPFLLRFGIDVSQSLLSVTTVVALLATGLRGLTGLALRFLGKRPETQIQGFVILLETLNAGLTTMLNKTKILIEKTFFITALLTATGTAITLITTGVTGLASLVSPFLALTFVGITGIRFATAKISDMLLRLRASAGDGRAQTTLFLRALRSLFPILDAIAKNARPIARMIKQFAKGGFEKKIKQVIGQFQQALRGISRIETAIKRLSVLLESTAKRVIKSMDQFISKADALFQKIGRQGARDALGSIERVRRSAVGATNEVISRVDAIAPAAKNAEKSATRLGARLVGMGKRALGLVGPGTGGLLGLMLFGGAGNVIALLNPLNLFRNRLLGVAKEAGAQAQTTGAVVQATFIGSAERAIEGITTLVPSLFAGLLDGAVVFSRKLWFGVITNPRTIVEAVTNAGALIASISPVLAVGIGAVVVPLVLRGAKNLAVASFGVLVDASANVWPVIKKRLIEPVKDFLLFLPRKVRDFATKTVPEMVNRLVARVFKGTVAIGERVKQFFGLTELTEGQANEKAIAAIQKRVAGMREQEAILKKRMVLLQQSAIFGKDEIARSEKLKVVQKALQSATLAANKTERELLRGEVADPKKAQVKFAEQRKEVEKLRAEVGLLALPFEEVQQQLIETETQLRSLTKTMSEELSRATIEKITKEIRANSRPVRKAFADIGIDGATVFASGFKGAIAGIAAVFIAPFSGAATKRLLGIAAANLGKTFRASFSLALRAGGGLFRVVGAALKGIGKFLGEGIFGKGFALAGKAAAAVGRAATGKAGTTAGLTAGTAEEESAKRKVDADKKVLAIQAELTEVLRAEKTVAEAAIKQKQLERQTSELQINNQKLMSGEMEKTENVLREMVGAFEGLTGLAQKLEDRTRETAARLGGFSETLDPAGFESALDLAREIDQALPNFKEMRAQFERLADATGLDVREREDRRGKLNAAEESLKSNLDERAQALGKLTGASQGHIAAMRKGLAALEEKAASDKGVAGDQERIIALRTKIGQAVQAAETNLLTELKKSRKKLAEGEATTAELTESRKEFGKQLEAAANSVNSAAFAKFSKEIIRQTEALAGAKKGTKAATEAKDKLDRAIANRQKVIERSTVDEKQAFAKASAKLDESNRVLKLRADEDLKLTKRVREVSQVMLLSRTALTQLPGKVKAFTAVFDKITKTEGTEYLSTLAAQNASGQELKVFTDRATVALKAQVDAIELSTDAHNDEVSAAEKVLKARVPSIALQKQLNKALKTSTIREEQLAGVAKEVSDALADVKVADDMVADATMVQGEAVEESTSATKEMSVQARRVAGALERAKLSIDEGGQSFKELAAAAADQTADVTQRPKRQGARVGQGGRGELADLVALVMTRLSPSQLEKAPLTPIREAAKGSPELRAIKGVGESAESLEVVLAILNEITQKPLERIKRLGDGFSNLVTLLKRLTENPERLKAFTDQFGPKTITSLAETVGLLDKMVSVVKKIKVPGGAGARGELKKFEATALQTLGQLIQKGIEGSIDFSEIPDRLLKSLREGFQNVKSISFGDKGKQAIASELELAVRGALKQVSGRLSARGEAGIAIAKSIAGGLAAGAPALAIATDKMLKPLVDRIETKSPPKLGPLRNAMLSMKNYGRVMGQQMLLGIGALKNLADQFMRQGFEGLLPAAFKAGAAVADKLVGGFGRGLSKLGGFLDKFSIPGKIAALPIKIAGALVQALAMVTAGLANMAGSVIGTITKLVKETSLKLLKLGLDATRLRLDPNRLKRFGEAMGILGGNASEAEAGLQQLIQSIEQVARGSAPELERAFARAGLSFEDLQNMQADDIFLRIAGAANESGIGIRRQSELLRLIGADFSNLRGIVLQGSEKIANAFIRANKNPPISQKTLDLAAKFTGIMSQIEQTIERIKIIIFEELAPILDDALSTFGDSAVSQVDFILENVRAGVRIVIQVIALVGAFINKRYIQAADGAGVFFDDLTRAGKVVFAGLGKILGIVVENGVKIVASAAEAVFFSIKGKTKSNLSGLLVDFLAFTASVANLVLSPLQTVLIFAGRGIKIALAKGKLFFFKLLDKILSKATDGINAIIDALNAIPLIDLDIEQVDLGGMKQAISDAKDGVRALNDKELPNFFDLVKEKFKATEKDIDRASKKLKEMFDVTIAVSEVQAFLEGIKGSADEAERLRATIHKIAPDMDIALLNAEQLRNILLGAAAGGFIDPGAISEGTERLRKEAIKAMGDVADETGKALKKAFEVGFDSLTKEFPEMAALLREIGVIGQKELDAAKIRIIELRKEQERTNEEIKKEIRHRKAIVLLLRQERLEVEALRKSFDLRKEIQTLTEGVVGPFQLARREAADLQLQMRERILELKEFFKEASRDLTLPEQLKQAAAMAVELGDAATNTSLDIEELAAAAEALRVALTALSSGPPQQRAAQQKAVDEAAKRLKAAKKAAEGTVGGIRDDIAASVADGFRDGMERALAKPIVDIINKNLVMPLLDGFKSTIKGLVDGTLIEAARAAEETAKKTGQAFSKVLFIIADFGKKIFERAFDSLLDTIFEQLQGGITDALTDAFKDAEGASTGLGEAAGAAIGAAITAAIALAGLVLSRLQGEISATEEAVQNIVESSEAIRGVISGTTTVAIKEAEDAFRDAQRPIVVRLDAIINLMRAALGGGNIPAIPLSGAGSTAI